MMAQPPHILFYDGHCGLCRRAIRSIQWFGCTEPIRFIDVHHQREMRHYPAIDRNQAMHSVILLTPPATQHHGYDAITEVIARMRLLHPLRRPLQSRVIHPLGTKLYDWISRNRYQISHRLGWEHGE